MYYLLSWIHLQQFSTSTMTLPSNLPLTRYTTKTRISSINIQISSPTYLRTIAMTHHNCTMWTPQTKEVIPPLQSANLQSMLCSKNCIFIEESTTISHISTSPSVKSTGQHTSSSIDDHQSPASTSSLHPRHEYDNNDHYNHNDAHSDTEHCDDGYSFGYSSPGGFSDNNQDDYWLEWLLIWLIVVYIQFRLTNTLFSHVSFSLIYNIIYHLIFPTTQHREGGVW